MSGENYWKYIWAWPLLPELTSAREDTAITRDNSPLVFIAPTCNHDIINNNNNDNNDKINY